MPAHIILFDFDGTLADSAQCAILATRQAFRDHHLPAPADAAIVQQMGIPIERCFRTLGATALDDDAFAALLATFRQHYAAAAESHIRLYPGIAALLAALKAQQRQTGIVSSKKNRHPARQLRTTRHQRTHRRIHRLGHGAALQTAFRRYPAHPCRAGFCRGRRRRLAAFAVGLTSIKIPAPSHPHQEKS